MTMVAPPMADRLVEDVTRPAKLTATGPGAGAGVVAGAGAGAVVTDGVGLGLTGLSPPHAAASSDAANPNAEPIRARPGVWFHMVRPSFSASSRSKAAVVTARTPQCAND